MATGAQKPKVLELDPVDAARRRLPPGWKPGDMPPGINAEWRGFKMPGLTWTTLKKKWSVSRIIEILLFLWPYFVHLKLN